MSTLSVEKLKENVEYDIKTGLFVYIKTRKEAGYSSHRGYIKIYIENNLYYAHRLAILYTEGFMPKNLCVDHINGNTSDNRRVNLRITSQSCNIKNSKLSSRNTSGVKGVCAFKGKWRSRIKGDGKVQLLGDFTSFNDAVLSRFNAEKKYGYSDCIKETSAALYLKANNLI